MQSSMREEQQLSVWTETKDYSEWSCPSCSYHNSLLEFNCSQCRKQRPRYKRRNEGSNHQEDHTWVCDSCSSINFKKGVKCFRCPKERGEQLTWFEETAAAATEEAAAAMEKGQANAPAVGSKDDSNMEDDMSSPPLPSSGDSALDLDASPPFCNHPNHPSLNF